VGFANCPAVPREKSFNRFLRRLLAMEDRFIIERRRRTSQCFGGTRSCAALTIQPRVSAISSGSSAIDEHALA